MKISLTKQLFKTIFLTFLSFEISLAATATFQGRVDQDGGDPYLEVWFEYGKTSALGFSTPHQDKYGAGDFEYTVSGLENCTTYYYRAVAKHKNYDDTSYGEIKTFTTPCPQIQGIQSPTIQKRVRNLSKGEIYFSKTTVAEPGERVEFEIKIDAGSGAKNLRLTDSLPEKMRIDQESLKINGSPFSGNILSGISLGDLSQGQTKTITFVAEIASKENFAFGVTNLSNMATIYWDGDSLSDYATVQVRKAQVAGAATQAPTGIEAKKLAQIISISTLGLTLASLLFKNQFSLVLAGAEMGRDKMRETLSQILLERKISKFKRNF